MGIENSASNQLFGGPPGRKIEPMTRATETVLANALLLEPGERAELAAELLASLDGPAEADANSAWAAEIKRRSEALDAGSTDLEAWENVKERIERGLRGR